MAAVFHGGGIARAAARHGIPAAEWLDLSTGINPVPPALPDLPLNLFQRLPDEDLIVAARQAAAEFYGSGPVLPIAAPGTQPIIRILAAQLPPGRVAVLSPTYGEYRAVFSQAGHVVDELASLDEVLVDHRAVIVVNPNNPDGRLYSKADLLALAVDIAEQGALLIVDEAFGDLHPETSLAGATAHNPNLVVLRSFGKFFGLAGLRLSFAIAGEAYRSVIETGLGPWPVSGPALEIARQFLALDPQPIRQGIRLRAAALRGVLSGHGLMIAADAGLFLLVSTPDARALHLSLCEHAILTRVFDYRGDWMRIGLAPGDASLQRLSDALSASRSR